MHVLLETFILLITIVNVKGYLIQRRIDNNTWKTLPDRFEVPASLCNDDSASQCISMGAQKVGHCKCECDDVSKTFGYFNDQWNCTKIIDVKQITDCKGEVENYLQPGQFSIFTIPLRPKVTIEYKPRIFKPQICVLNQKSGYYMQCNGSWEKFNPLDNYGFSISENGTITPYGQGIGPILNGSLIELHINCGLSFTFCALFKIEGTKICYTATPPPIPPITTTSTSSSSIATSKVQTSAAPERALTSSTTTTEESKTFISTSDPGTEFSTPTGQTLAPFVKKTKTPKTSDNSGLIAGVTGGVVALIVIALVIIIFVVIRRRKERHNVSRNIAENRGYENSSNIQLPPNDQEYDYAYSQPPIGKPQPKHKETKSSVTNRVYGLTEDLNSQGSNNNTSDGPVYAKPDKTKKTKDSNEQDNSVFYHTLEGPKVGCSNNEPVYNELEAPDSQDASNYRALEGNVPHIYSALVRPSSDQVDSTCNLQDYDSVGSII